MTNVHKILVPIALDENGRTALKQAVFFHDVFSLKITLLHVIPASSYLKRTIFRAKNEEGKKEALDKIEKFTKDFFEGEVPDFVDFKISVGSLVPQIVKASKMADYDLIIIKKRKRKTGNWGISQQNDADKIIGQSQCPVITINEDWASKIKKIIIPIDISQKTEKKLLWASSLAKKFAAKMVIVSALNVNIDETKSLAYKNGQRIKQMLNERDVECDLKILKSTGKENHKVILDYAKEQNIDLFVIRTHQDALLNKNDIGTFASEIIHSCNVPVFTIGYPTIAEELVQSIIS